MRISVNNGRVLYFVITAVALAAAAAALTAAYILSGRNEPVGFELPRRLSAEEIKAQLRSLSGADDAGRARADLRLVKKYCAAAQSAVASELAEGEEPDAYARRFAENRMTITDAIAEAERALRFLEKLPRRNEGGVLAFADLLARNYGGTADEGLVAECVALANARRPFTDDELHALRPAFVLAHLRTAAVYASKILVRRRMKLAARKDAAKGRPDRSRLTFASYVKEYARLRAVDTEKIRAAGRDPYAAETEDAQTLAAYDSGMRALVESLRDKAFSEEFTQSLSAAANVYSLRSSFSRTTVATRAELLRRNAKIAKKSGESEETAARRICDEAERTGADVSELLLPRPKDRIVFRAVIVAIASAAVAATAAAAVGGAAGIAVAALALPVAFAAADAAFMRIASFVTDKPPVPELARGSFDPPRTAIVICAALSCDGDVAEALERLAEIRAANPSPMFACGLLADCIGGYLTADAEKAARGMSGGEFFLLRKRPTERKRGALRSFARAALSGNYDEYAVKTGDISGFKYAITLDSDTFTRDAERLVAVMEHPYNARYAVMSLDMRVAVSSLSSPFARLTSGRGDVSHYGSGDAHYALHGCSIYCGKGIFRLREFADAAADAFPDGKILSHDLLEGGLAGCRNSGIAALEDAPQTSEAYYSRAERWMRGDIQSLPYLRKNARNAYGEKRGTGVPPSTAFTAIVNAVSALVPVISLVLVALAAALRDPAPIIVGFLPEIAALLFAARGAVSALSEAAQSACRAIVSAAYLPYRALISAVAVATACVRMATGKKLLEWKPYTPTGKGIPLLPAGLAAGITFAAVFAFLPSVCSAVAALLFLASVPMDLALSRSDPKRRPAARELAFVTELAERTWKYFTAAFSATDSGLPPDNYSEESGWAMRTSPTNIGMALSASLCAAKLGTATREECDERIARLLTALKKLRKYRGCPYNWYDARTGRPLSPRYVSSVDCGNLIAALMHVRACGGKNAAAADELIRGADIGFLLSDGLMRIGYNADTGEFDAGKYDLLASESALTYLVAYACGKTNAEGYEKLSRRSLRCGGSALASWSGGAFEYMLPLLYFDAPERSLLAESARGAVRAQKKYAAAKGSALWGASESLYGERYDNGDLKYRAFGAEGIALSLTDGRAVFAPYASVMCAAVVRGAERGLSEMLAPHTGEYGLYDSYDAAARTEQRAYMTHHQGMIMLSAARLMHVGAWKTIKRDPGARAARRLLEESPTPLRNAAVRPAATPSPRTICERETAARYDMPQINLMTDGHYALITDECGRSAQYCGGMLLTRFDDMDGLRIFADDGSPYEITVGAKCFHACGASRYVFRKGALETETLAALLPGKNAEIRRIVCRNISHDPVAVSFTAVAVPCLTSRDADLAHKTFSRMFTETAYDDAADCVYAVRHGETTRLALIAGTPSEYYGDERYLKTGKGIRFGRTTEAALAAKTNVIMAAGEKRTLCFALCCGGERETRSVADLCRDGGFVDSAIAESRALLCNRPFTANACDAASALLFGGRTNGAPRRITLVATEESADRTISSLELIRALREFGIFCSVAVISRLRHSYASSAPARLRSAAEALLDCRIIDISFGVTDEAAEALAAGADLRSLRGKAELPFPEPREATHPPVPLARPTVEYPLGIGGFTAGGEYVVDVSTPSPWYNVISDGKIGCLISDRGECTFASNSREEKLTRHSCDELRDVPGDGITIEENGCLWTPSRAIERACEYVAVHGCGFTELACGYNSVRAVRRVWICDGAKYSRLTLENAANVRRTLHVMYFAELVLGDTRQRAAGGIVCAFDGRSVRAEGNGLSVALTADRKADSVGLRAENYRDAAGRIRTCRGLGGGGITPALAYSCRIVLPPKGKADVVFALSARPVTVTAESAAAAERESAKAFVGFPGITSDEKPIKYYLRTLAYQTLAARFTAKCGFQQPGGATGFRDALQDATALFGICPGKTRELLLACAAHQFESGDVMHWWHEPARGVRTKICDDKLFLAYAAAEYVEYTGDASVLDEAAPYLRDVPIPKGSHSVYADMSESETRETLKQHIMRAFRSVELSPRGLVKMGGGDWNDGMDGVGAEGKGESVWCGMFAYYVAGRFLPYADGKDREFLARLRATLRASAPICRDEKGYKRAFDDRGRQVGESGADLLTAAWAVLCGWEKGESARALLLSAYGRLYDPRKKLLRLLDPPFTDSSVGYIADYPPGVRENGGQYNHAAVWFVRALFAADLDELGCRLLRELLPCSRTADAESTEIYLKEPYVMAGDVYSGALAGRGGWTWYTGAAGWMYRTIVECYYGLRVKNGSLTIRPHMTEGKATVRARINGCDITAEIEAHGGGEHRVCVDGAQYGTDTFVLRSLSGRNVRVVREQTAATAECENR